MAKKPERACWCGSEQLAPFAPSYRVCLDCATVVSAVRISAHVTQAMTETAPNRTLPAEVNRDAIVDEAVEAGKRETARRARADLPERCLHWLKILLGHRTPPARVLDLGCNAGALVALLGWAGYDASGVELNPWVAQFARVQFGVAVSAGLIEDSPLPAGSLDVMVLNDVVEHLPAPRVTLAACARLVADDGLLLIQTPGYPEGLSYQQLLAHPSRFTEMMTEAMAADHLYLYSERSIRRLLGQLGFGHVEFQPILFPYDMLIVASRRPLVRRSEEEIERSLLATPIGRLVLALLDKDREAGRLMTSWQAAEADRAARLEVIHQLARDVGTLQQRLHAAGQEKNAEPQEAVEPAKPDATPGPSRRAGLFLAGIKNLVRRAP
jgi:SAM-dependent methyltransferase